jgi:glyoxylase-like metal-dependent hydrolase (beta-lactamase superfamily II)
VNPAPTPTTFKPPHLVFGPSDSVRTVPILDLNLDPSLDAPKPLNAPAIYSFSPNRDTLGGTAYFVADPGGNLLIDCPAWHEGHEAWLAAQGGVRWLVLTHRGGMGQVREIQARFGCEVVVQEQEAYLLPDVPTQPFHQSCRLSPELEVIWTPGHSPGSACIHHSAGILFAGRHLLPQGPRSDHPDHPAPLYTAKTFHWPRQIRSVQMLIDRFGPETLGWICPGASLGLLRGRSAMGDAYAKLSRLDLGQLLVAQRGPS